MKNLRASGTADSQDGADKQAKVFTCSDNIEKDEDDLVRQMESSWAQRQGIPTKSGSIMHHGVTI